MIYIPEITISGFQERSDGSYVAGIQNWDGFSSFRDKLQAKNDGDVFPVAVVIDGKRYETNAIYRNISGMPIFCIGNTKYMGSSFGETPDTGEPFCVNLTYQNLALLVTFEGESHTLSVANIHVNESSGDGYALYNGVKVLASEVPEGAESIPLDGMNVIEWDGDTTGLNKTALAYYHVSSACDVDTSKNNISVPETGSIRTQGWVAMTFGYRSNQVASYVQTPSDDYPLVGIGLHSHTRLFAYYPITSGGGKGKLLTLWNTLSRGVFKALTGKTHWLE